MHPHVGDEIYNKLIKNYKMQIIPGTAVFEDLLDECKNETDDERRDVVRKLVLHELERMEKEHLVQQ